MSQVARATKKKRDKKARKEREPSSREIDFPTYRWGPPGDAHNKFSTAGAKDVVLGRSTQNQNTRWNYPRSTFGLMVDYYHNLSYSLHGQTSWAEMYLDFLCYSGHRATVEQPNKSPSATPASRMAQDLPDAAFIFASMNKMFYKAIGSSLPVAKRVGTLNALRLQKDAMGVNVRIRFRCHDAVTNLLYLRARTWGGGRHAVRVSKTGGQLRNIYPDRFGNLSIKPGGSSSGEQRINPKTHSCATKKNVRRGALIIRRRPVLEGNTTLHHFHSQTPRRCKLQSIRSSSKL